MKILRSIVCPNCWREFPPAQLRFISESPRLRGDPVLGPTEQLRFRAMRFDAAGNAIDPDEARCNRLACPTCHIEIPRALIELRSRPISVVGAPGSGKTNLLASGLWGLAQRARDFGLQLVDADPRFNTTIHRNQNQLFSGVDGDADVTLPKTEEGGNELYRSVRINGNKELVPRPAFYITSQEGSSSRSVMVLYDNAGEHFLPGATAVGLDSATRHMERSSAIIMVFDPMQDRRFRARYAGDVDAPHSMGHERQELVFIEAIARIRRLRGLDPTAAVTIPIVVTLTKADVWADAALGSDWHTMSLPVPPDERRRALVDRLREIDLRVRTVLLQVSPEFANAVESLAEQVWFVPASALGTSPVRGSRGSFSLRANEIRPKWAEMPFVLALALADPKTNAMLAS